MVEWQIIEASAYQRSVNAAGGARFCDEAIAPILYALRRYPLGFPDAHGGRVKLAKIKLRVVGRTVLPAMRVWFRAELNKREVVMLWIEHCPPESMPHSERWFWDEDDEDKQPF